jgi:hypothetical protein
MGLVLRTTILQCSNRSLNDGEDHNSRNENKKEQEPIHLLRFFRAPVPRVAQGHQIGPLSLSLFPLCHRVTWNANRADLI